ncbi:hypothetical protein QFZ77_003561 [Paenibacillus sp. V4I3]|nr:hypothetical protein [Paenibacillus sp. V4I3]MDQ0889347.1 hypothetical protein [Paenibacillus sp. V4I9]
MGFRLAEFEQERRVVTKGQHRVRTRSGNTNRAIPKSEQKTFNTTIRVELKVFLSHFTYIGEDLLHKLYIVQQFP